MRTRATQRIAAAAAGLALALLGQGFATRADASAGREGASDRGDPPVCGAPGLPPCPLQRWMRSRVATPLAEENLEVLAVNLERTATFSPDPAWSAWPDLARRGARAAKRGDLSEARAACKGCHDRYREAYRAKFRLRPVPR